MSDLYSVIEKLNDIFLMDVSVYDSTFLEKAVLSRMQLYSKPSVEGYLEFLEEDSREQQSLLESLNNSYTTFFRNPLTFAYLETYLLPNYFARSEQENAGGLRIWSAACSTGEEPYSLAMLLEEFKQARLSNFSYTIIATDHSQDNLDKAIAGVYDFQELGNLRVGQLQKFFTKAKEKYGLNANLREKIDFSYYDLLDPQLSSPPSGIYGDFDVIFCSNLLYYYNKKAQQYIINKLIKSLKLHGYLIVDETETSTLRTINGLRQVHNIVSIFEKI